MSDKSHKVTSPEKGHEDSNKTDEIHKAALVAGIVLPDDKETSTVTESDTDAPPQAPLESSDSDDTALVPFLNPETIHSRHTKHVHFADVEPDLEPNLLDMVPPSPIQSGSVWAYSHVQHTVSVDTMLCQQKTPESVALSTMGPSVPTTTLIDTLQWRRKTTFPRLELTLPSPQTLLDNMLHDKETPGMPTVEKALPFFMPLIQVLPPLENPQTVITTGDIHASEGKLNMHVITPVITPLGTPVSPFPDSDDLTETLLDVPETEYVDADRRCALVSICAHK